VSDLNRELLATLGELTDELVEQAGPTGDFAYVDISSIDRESKKISAPKPLTLAQAPSRAKQVLKAGDVLVSMTRPNLNAVALVPENLDGAIGSTGFHVLRSRWLTPGFLLALVQTQNFIDAMSKVVQGALYPAVRPRDIAAYSFSFETPAQQTRIVAKLEELLSDLDVGVAELKAVQKKLAQYRQSLLKAAVEGALTAEWREKQKAVHPDSEPVEPIEGLSSAHGSTSSPRTDESETGAQLLQRILAERRARWEAKQLAKFTEQGKTPPKDWQKKYSEPVQPDTTNLPALPERWVWASVEQIAELVSGNTPKDAETSACGNGEIAWFKVGDMNRKGNEVWLSDSAFKFEPKTAIGLGLKIAPRGTIVFPKRGGAIATNKKRRLATDACFDLNTMGLVPIDSVSDWLWWWFQGVDLGRLSDGSNVPQINNPDIAPLLVPIPPADEQSVILNALMSATTSIADQVSAVELALQQSTAQRQNILRAAFSGQLVPQDPNDEPASVLLERIRAERAAARTNGKTTTRRTRHA
jgi:type I restriction enzyme S subunit